MLLHFLQLIPIDLVFVDKLHLFRVHEVTYQLPIVPLLVRLFLPFLLLVAEDATIGVGWVAADLGRVRNAKGNIETGHASIVTLGLHE